jgi:hypothetical protein
MRYPKHAVCLEIVLHSRRETDRCTTVVGGLAGAKENPRWAMSR